jgi:hypothetical protein
VWRFFLFSLGSLYGASQAPRRPPTWNFKTCDLIRIDHRAARPIEPHTYLEQDMVHHKCMRDFDFPPFNGRMAGQP